MPQGSAFLFGVVAYVHGTNGDRDSNARLVASAPELYEALRALIDYTASTKAAYTAGGAQMERARAALAKADGRAVTSGSAQP